MWSQAEFAGCLNELDALGDTLEADEKLLLRRVGSRLTLARDVEHYYALDTLGVVTPKKGVDISLRYLLAILNSRLINYYYFVFLKSTKKTFSEAQDRQLAEVPIILNLKPAVRAYLEQLADRMAALVEARSKAQNPQKVNALDHEIFAVDRAIDKAVYELYELSEDEIAIVEALPVSMA